VGFVNSSVDSVGTSYQSSLFCDTDDREMCCKEENCLYLSQKHTVGGFGVSGLEPSDSATGQLVIKMDLSEHAIRVGGVWI
jgi:hypothetical protein